MQLLVITLFLPTMLFHGAPLTPPPTQPSVMPFSLTPAAWNAGILIEGVNVRFPGEILDAKQTHCAFVEVPFCLACLHLIGMVDS